MKQYIKNRFRERKRQIGLTGFLTLLVLSVTFLGLTIPKIMAGDTQVTDLTLQGESNEQVIALTVRDEHPEDTKIVIPLPEGITYTSSSNPNIGVTYDELNKQVVIDWVVGEEKQVQLQLEAEQEGHYDFTARTVRDGEPVTSLPCSMRIETAESSEEITEQSNDSEFVENDSTNSNESSSLQDSKIENESNEISKASAVVEGDFGTSHWYINELGELHIGEGEFVNTTDNKSPWNEWANEIISIHFDGKVVAASIISSLFRGMPNLVTIENIQYLDTSNTTDMENVFLGDSSLKSLDLSSWNTSKVTTIYGIFRNASSLEAINVSNWDTSNFNQLAYAFCNLPNLKHLDLSQWRVTPVTSTLSILTGGYVSMFEGDSSLEELDLSGFSTKNMNSFYLGKTSFDNMFSGMKSLKVLTLGEAFVFNGQQPQNAALPNIVVNDMYTGFWLNVGNGTIESPEASRRASTSSLVFNHRAGGSWAGIADTYVRQRAQGADVTVKYEDEFGQPLAKEEVLQGYFGDEYKSVQKDIEGATFKEVKDNNASGKFTKQPQTVTYVYKMKAGDVTAKYVNTQGKEIDKQEIFSGFVGDAYETTQKNIDGYKFKKTEGAETSGKLMAQPQTVTYVYTTDTLSFYSVPKELGFNQTKIRSRTQTVERKEPSWKMVVEDTRLNKGNWRVTASLAEQFKDSSGNPLENNILIFSKGNQPEQWITSGSDVDVFDGSSSEDKELYDVSWNENEGPLLQVAPGTVKVGKYTGVINWTLVDAPV